MKYNCEMVDSSGITYSIDLIHIKFQASHQKVQNFINELFEQDYDRIIKYTSSNKNHEYRHFWSIEYPYYGTVRLCYHLNGISKEADERGYLEYNPNLFKDCDLFERDISLFKYYHSWAELGRYDLAIDLPISREKLLLIKDNREYICMSKSSYDKTEYLGRRNKPGRVKLYNKTVESKLDYPLTRLEVTGDVEHLNIPTVIDMRHIPRGKDGILLRAIYTSQSPGEILNDLTPYQRSIILKAMNADKISFDMDCIKFMVSRAIFLGSGTTTLKYDGRKDNVCIQKSSNKSKLTLQ